MKEKKDQMVMKENLRWLFGLSDLEKTCALRKLCTVEVWKLARYAYSLQKEVEYLRAIVQERDGPKVLPMSEVQTKSHESAIQFWNPKETKNG